MSVVLDRKESAAGQKDEFQSEGPVADDGTSMDSSRGCRGHERSRKGGRAVSLNSRDKPALGGCCFRSPSGPAAQGRSNPRPRRALTSLGKLTGVAGVSSRHLYNVPAASPRPSSSSDRLTLYVCDLEKGRGNTSSSTRRKKKMANGNCWSILPCAKIRNFCYSGPCLLYIRQYR